jgi:hypothetical protein
MKRTLLLVMVAACGSDPVNYSSPVGIELKAKSGDVSGTVITEQKDITTESGNPFGAFVNDATHMLGRDPTRIELDELTLTLGAQSTGVSGLEQVVASANIEFLVNDTNNTYGAGVAVNPTGIGPVEVQTTFRWEMVSDVDRPKMLGGSFKVVIIAPAAADFATKGAEASLQTTFTFAAFE